MAWQVDLGALLNVISGAVLLLLGLGLIALDRRQRLNATLGLFCVAWGIQIATANAPNLTTDEALARAASATSIPFLLILPVLLLLAIGSVSRLRGPEVVWGTWFAAGTALLGSSVLLVRPEWVLGDVVGPYPPRAWEVAWGPLVPWVGTLPFTIAIVIALRGLLHARASARSVEERRRTVFAIGAMLLYGAYRFPDGVMNWVAQAVVLGPSVRGVSEIIISAVGVGAIGQFLVQTLRSSREAIDPGDRRETRLLVLAAVVPALAGTASDVPLLFGGTQLSTLGAFRLLMVGVLVWGAARYQLLHLDLSVRRLSPALGAALAPFLVVPVVSPLAASVGGSSPTVIALASVAVAVPLALVARSLTSGLGRRPNEQQRLIMYSAAVASGESEPTLSRLRERLRIAPADHELLVEALGTRRKPPPAPRDAGPGDVLFGSYRVERVLAETPHGPALLAHDVLLDRQVVVKPLGRLPDDADLRDRMLREGRVAARLRHPRIVEVHKVEREGEDLHLVTEFVPGGDLRALVAAGGPVAVDRASAIVADALEALEVVHAQGVVHRDITPGNVFLASDGRAKVGDFGLASAGGGPELAAGTLATASPEQLGGAPLTAASDVYSAGALLYWLITGRCYVPLEGRSIEQATQLIASAPPMLPLKGVPVAVNGVLGKALSKDPKLRFPSARTMREALGQATRRVAIAP